MKKNAIRFVKVLSLLLAVTLTLGTLQFFVFSHTDHNSQRVNGFFLEDKESLDLVILGASEVYADFAPGYAYEYSGVTSYLFATQANSILNYKSQLKNILSRQDPDLIVIELNGAVYGDNEQEEITKAENLHFYADNVPLDCVKLDYILHTVPSDQAEYLFPFIKYHGAWEELENSQLYRRTVAQDEARGYSYLKGILNVTDVFTTPELSFNSELGDYQDDTLPLNPVAEQALRDLLQYCKDEGLEKKVVFARFPHIVVTRNYERFQRSNRAGQIVAEYGFDYINFEAGFDGLDESTDFYNLEHLNVYGQKKFTAFLTDYLTAHYGLKAHALTADETAEWTDCARYYDAYYRYSDELIGNGESRELSEDSDLIAALKAYLS